MNPSNILELTIRIASVGVLLSCSEFLYMRAILRRPGLLASEVAQTRSPLLMKGKRQYFFSKVFGIELTLVLLVARWLSAVCLLLIPLSVLPTSIIALTGIYIGLRSPYGLDGSDQMTNIVFGASALGLAVGSELAQSFVLIFLAATVVQAYFVAGIEKFRSHTWRCGDAIPAVALTKLYGIRQMGECLRKWPMLCWAVAWFVILFETLFPVAYAVPGPAWIVAIASAGLFHLVAAGTMGLNTFFWAFASTYPALVFCRHHFPW